MKRAARASGVGLSAPCPCVSRSIRTPVGVVVMGAGRAGVERIWLEDSDQGSPLSAEPEAAIRHHLDILTGELEAYFAGESAVFTTTLAPAGTEFQRRVWEELLQIPAGQTRSYAEIARAIGRPSAVRAVARANATNPISILVPCHRVIGSDGSLTGYGGGLDRKKWLLDHERTWWGGGVPEASGVCLFARG